MKKTVFLFVAVLFFSFANSQTNDPFQLVDLHVHLKGGFTMEDAVKKSVDEGIKYGIVVNCGIGVSGTQ